MIKYKLIFSSVLFLFLIMLGILIWRTSLLFIDLADILPNAETSSDSEQGIKTNTHEETISLNESPQIIDNRTNNRKLGHYETIDETIARIKRDVIVTGTIIGVSGQESAIF